MDHLKRYESRNKRRRASRNRGNRNRKRSGETSYYMSRSKYGSSSAQTVNRKYLAIGGIVVILLLAVIFIFALRPFSGKSGGDTDWWGTVIPGRADNSCPPEGDCL